VSDRVPYAERPEIIERHCTCHWVWTESDGRPIRHNVAYINPTCPLHGDRRQPSPF